MGARYSDEEVDEILRRAIERQRDDSTKLSHDDLVAAAGEIGIDPKDVEAAIAEVRAAAKPAAASAPAKERPAPRVADDDEEDDETLLADDVRGRRARFVRHFISFLVVNAAMAGMNLLTGPPWWFLWIVLGWGIGVAMQAARAFIPDDPQRQKQRLRRLRRRRDRELRRDRAHARRTRGHERKKDFERAVQEGVGLLLSTAARKIAEAVDRHREEEERRKGGVRVQLDDDDRKVRVEVPPEDKADAASGTAADASDARKQRE